ncbi:butyrophilin subfamily 1 member A1-like isoform X3 [Strix aluco]|uniref:butyrophilin subfamily 1 member A1-like isoform X3 n=1 Tax=Strix aluco TaxID=111821 RepID=UPI003DA6955B
MSRHLEPPHLGPFSPTPHKLPAAVGLQGPCWAPPDLQESPRSSGLPLIDQKCTILQFLLYFSHFSSRFAVPGWRLESKAKAKMNLCPGQRLVQPRPSHSSYPTASPQMRFPASPRGLLSSLVTLHVLRLGSDGFRVVAPVQPLRGTVGQDVVLPCHVSPRKDAQGLEIRWIRNRFSEMVHHYRNGEDQDGEQLRDYQGRTELVRAGLSNGSLDLRLLGLRPSDDGQYVCTVQDATSYGEATVDLEVGATGSVPQLSLEAYGDGGIRVRCRSAGWYPQPQVLWKDAGGQRLPSLSQRRSSDERGLFDVEDVTVVSGSGAGNFSCVVRNSRLEQEQEASLHISAPFFHDARPWMVALPVLLVLLAAVTGLGAWLWRRKVLQSRELEERDAALGEQAALLAERDKALAWRKFLLPENPDVVTLDPDTAHSQLVVSADRRRVTLGSAPQKLPFSLKRFRNLPCVLGREGFRKGRHCWEVEVMGEVGGDSHWAVGVVKDSVKRDGNSGLRPDEGVWAMRHFGGQFESHTSPPKALPQSLVPRRIWVCLDCAEGLVTFINAETGAKIFTFPPARFNGETLRPWFWLTTENTQLCLRGGPPQPLCPPPIPTAAPSSSCPSPDTPRSSLLGPAAADAPLSPAPAQGAEGH